MSSWRTTFTDAIVAALEEIVGTGTVTRDFQEQRTEHPMLRINVVRENYDHTLGRTEGPTSVEFTILGDVQSGDFKKYEELDDFIDDMVQAVEGISGYTIILDETTFHERAPGPRLIFETRGTMIVEKDYSSM